MEWYIARVSLMMLWQWYYLSVAKPHVRIFPSSMPIALLKAKELGDAIRNTVPFILI